MINRTAKLYLIPIFALILSFSCSIFIGSFHFEDLEQFKLILFELRIPRTLAALITGGLLGLSGTLMQLLLQNPLADPYVLGVSGGAALWTLLFMFFEINSIFLPFAAWFGSLFTILFILGFAKKHGWQSNTLLLTGIALSCAYSAAISFILIMTPDTNLHSMLFWLSGDLNGVTVSFLPVMILLLGFILCLFLAPGFNILARGDLPALSLGLAVKRYRILLYLLTSLFSATAVGLAGCIGFIGLIVPHLTRLIVGYNHRLVVPLSTLFGASLLMCADTLARTLFTPIQIPVGIFLSILGIPIFLVLLKKK